MDENRFFLPAWGVSLALHGVVAGLALAFVAQVKPILPEDVFKWDVALVDPVKADARSQQTEPAVLPDRLPPKMVSPSPVKRVPDAARPVSSVEHKVEPPQPTVETVQSIEPKVEVPQVQEEPTEQRIADVIETKAEPVVATKTAEPVAAFPETVESYPVQNKPDTATPASSSEAQEPPRQASSPDSTMNALPTPAHETKEDNRWLAESLWRRVAELKRYPISARMNGQEGKVILKAIIRSDGQLADVIVHKSSGYSALDAAAIEAVKLACPLDMKHAIGKPQIVVSLPIVYSLAN